MLPTQINDGHSSLLVVDMEFENRRGSPNASHCLDIWAAIYDTRRPGDLEVVVSESTRKGVQVLTADQMADAKAKLEQAAAKVTIVLYYGLPEDKLFTDKLRKAKCVDLNEVIVTRYSRSWRKDRVSTSMDALFRHNAAMKVWATHKAISIISVARFVRLLLGFDSHRMPLATLLSSSCMSQKRGPACWSSSFFALSFLFLFLLAFTLLTSRIWLQSWLWC